MAEFYSVFQSIWTIVVMVIFLGIVAWAWSSKNQKHFEEAANLPFDDDDDTNAQPAHTKEKDNV